MNEENKNLEEDFEFDELDNKIILNDEEGNEIEFEFGLFDENCLLD